MRREQVRRSGSRKYQTGVVTHGEFDANLRRLDERMSRLFARSDERHQENVRSNARLLAEMDRRHAALLDSFRTMFDTRLTDMNRRIDDLTQHVHAEMAEVRKESRLLRWNIWIAACATVIGLASLNSATTSAVLSAFESGRNTGAAVGKLRAEVRHAPGQPRPSIAESAPP